MASNVLKEISIKDKTIFEHFFALRRHNLSVYNFNNIFIWRKLFKIYWDIIEGSLCLFFKDALGCFMYLSPLGQNSSSEIIKRCFKIMDGFNQNKLISRIENVEEKDLGFYLALGYMCKPKYGEYLCKRQDLVELKGNRFKSQRAAYNYFVKHYRFEFGDFSLKDKAKCLKLYKDWAKERKNKFKDPLYQKMLEDNLLCQKETLDNFKASGLIARIVKIKDEIKGYTFGFKLNPDTFCVLFEVCDLSQRGISQFIFREFCRELKGFKYINIMDDSGLENLRRVKLSYKPFKVIPSYIIKRKDVG